MELSIQKVFSIAPYLWENAGNHLLFLDANCTISIKRYSKISPIYLFFNKKLMPKKIIPFNLRHNFIFPYFDITEECQDVVWRGNLKKSSFIAHFLLIFCLNIIITKEIYGNPHVDSGRLSIPTICCPLLEK